MTRLKDLARAGYYLIDMYGKAALELETAVKGATGNPTIRYHLGMAQFRYKEAGDD